MTGSNHITHWWFPALATLALLLGAPIQAIVPGQMDFQGLLLDAGGSPVNGAVDLDFTLYDAASAGNALWSESHSSVPVVDGVYDVSLGATTPLTPALLSGGSVYLEIAVSGETLAPRRQLLAVPYALHAETSEALIGDTAFFIEQIMEHFAFDHGAPPNGDPREGFGDTDGDGLANFVDNDNDNDGLSDTLELAQGSDINLVTPAISGFSPGSAPGASATAVTIQGTGFEPGMSVVFGTETPIPASVTATSIDVVVGPQPVGSASVGVTRPGNGESATASFDFDQTLSISGLSPLSAAAAGTTTVTVTGTGFEPAMNVDLGTETPTPTDVTATSFDVVVGPQPVGAAAVSVTRTSNGENASASFDFQQTLSITGFFPTTLLFDVGGTVTVQGTGFETGMTVAFGPENPTPTNVTPTSFDVVLGPQPAGSANVTVTRDSNGENASSSFEFTTDRIVFFLPGVGDGNLGGVAGADAACSAAAATMGLQVPYLAWIADSTTSPATRFVQGGPYARLDGTTIATDWADLTDGTLLAPIVDTGGIARTNVATDGTAAGSNHCNDYTSTSGTSPVGNSTTSSSAWTDAGDHPCNLSAGLYCFPQ